MLWRRRRPEPTPEPTPELATEPAPALLSFRVEIPDRVLAFDPIATSELRVLVARFTTSPGWADAVGGGEVRCWHEPSTRSAILTGRIPDTEVHRAWIAALQQLAAEPSA